MTVFRLLDTINWTNIDLLSSGPLETKFGQILWKDKKIYISRKTMWNWYNKVSATLLRPCRNQWHVRHHPVVCVFWQIGYTCSLRRHQQTCYWLPLSSTRNNELKLTAPPHCWELTIYQKLIIIYAFTLSNIIRSQIWDKIWTKLQYTKCFFESYCPVQYLMDNDKRNTNL